MPCYPDPCRIDRPDEADHPRSGLTVGDLVIDEDRHVGRIIAWGTIPSSSIGGRLVFLELVGPGYSTYGRDSLLDDPLGPWGIGWDRWRVAWERDLVAAPAGPVYGAHVHRAGCPCGLDLATPWPGYVHVPPSWHHDAIAITLAHHGRRPAIAGQEAA